jgi:predicted esterase
MLRSIIPIAVAITLSVTGTAACKEEVAAFPGIAFPPAPFEIPAPVEPESRLAGVNLRTATIDELLELELPADAQSNENRYAVLYWLYRRAPEMSGITAMDLAFLVAQQQHSNEVFYWLQQSALHEGLDLDDLTSAKLTATKQDPRWQRFQSYLTGINAAWQHSGYRRQAVIVPAAYKVGTPISAFICLHGYGSRPEDFTGNARLHSLADATGMAVISLSATTPRGQQSFIWTENFEKDWTHLQAGLAAVKDRVTVARSGNIAVGFSQGAQLSAELAAAYPEFFAGAIVMSPGYFGTSRLNVALAKTAKAVAHQTYFVVWYDHEHPSTIDFAQRDIATLRGTGARVITHAYEGATHTFAPTIEDNFAIWSQVVREKH